MSTGPAMITDFLEEFTRYMLTGEKALAQIPELALERILAPGTNSIAMLVGHVSGNLRSRFTDFLTSDGEKPWRDRDVEFEPRRCSRAELMTLWEAGWSVALASIASLTDADLEREVTIRGRTLTVHAALVRSVAHTATHVGQIVLLARLLAYREWVSLSIPKSASKQYNLDPTREKRPT